jgi:hypothetical protein
MLYFKWFTIEDDEEIPDPMDFFNSKTRKELKVIEKTVQSPKTAY